MSNAIKVIIQPVGDTGLPTCELSGQRGNIPVITWPGDATAMPYTRVELMLGNHSDPVNYLRALGSQLADFASRIEQAAEGSSPLVSAERAAL